MQYHELQPKTKNKKEKRVGRGGKRGTTSGRGTKGQLARSGRKLRPELRDIIKKLPKLRGYRFKSIETKPSVVNLSAIETAFSGGESVTPKTLVEKGLIRARSGKFPVVKILGTGEITKKITVSGCEVSASAKSKIEKAGGKYE